MVRYLYAAESWIIGNCMIHVTITSSKSNLFLPEFQNCIQVVAPAILTSISNAKKNVNAVSALSRMVCVSINNEAKSVSSYVTYHFQGAFAGMYRAQTHEYGIKQHHETTKVEEYSALDNFDQGPFQTYTRCSVVAIRIFKLPYVLVVIFVYLHGTKQSRLLLLSGKRTNFAFSANARKPRCNDS